jgi:hypothetical protein
MLSIVEKIAGTVNNIKLNSVNYLSYNLSLENRISPEIKNAPINRISCFMNSLGTNIGTNPSDIAVTIKIVPINFSELSNICNLI